jgi:hypothetical protein
MTFSVENVRSAISMATWPGATVIAAAEAPICDTGLEALPSGFPGKGRITIGTVATVKSGGDAVLLEANTDRPSLICQDERIAVLMNCRRRFGNEAAA